MLGCLSGRSPFALKSTPNHLPAFTKILRVRIHATYGSHCSAKLNMAMIAVKGWHSGLSYIDSTDMLGSTFASSTVSQHRTRKQRV